VTLWETYKKSLKPLDVEEPIDVWVHRPIAFVLARSLLPTSVSPNWITVCAIVAGLASSYCMVRDFPGHLVYAGGWLFASAVLDCADGQLARLRGTSSVFGRMLDGVGDMTVSTGMASGATYAIWHQHREPAWHGLVAIVLCAATIVTTSFHSTMYDYYKNLFLRVAHPSQGEGEDYEAARERYFANRQAMSLFSRVTNRIYLFYIGSQTDFVRKFDPYSPKSLRALPPYDPERAAALRPVLLPMLRYWRGWFGWGSVIFGISVCLALGVIEYYMLFRLVVMNAVFYGLMRGGQRRASRLAFAMPARA
jgi:phosphatidylglycerophosphate synthase